MAPVDDANARAAVHVAARADEHVATLAVLGQAQVREVGRLRVDEPLRAAPALRPKRAEVVHLLEERRQVLGLRDGDLVP